MKFMGTSLVVQWLRLCTSTAQGAGLTPDQGTRILHAVWRAALPPQKKKFMIYNQKLTQ